jgi:hypothetical protein
MFRIRILCEGGSRSGFGISDPGKGGGGQNGLNKQKRRYFIFIRLTVLGGILKASRETGKSFKKFFQVLVNDLCLNPDSLANFEPNPELGLYFGLNI